MSVPLQHIPPEPTPAHDAQKLALEPVEPAASRRTSPLYSTRHYPFILAYCLLTCAYAWPLGWDIGTIGAIVSSSIFQQQYAPSAPSPAATGALVALFLLASGIGGTLTGVSAAKHGRKLAFQLACAVYMAGAVCTLLAVALAHRGSRSSPASTPTPTPTPLVLFVWGRILCGLATGLFNVLGPVYISEITPADIRGVCVLMFQVTCATAILAGNITACLLYSPSTAPPHTTASLLVCGVPAMFQLCLLWILGAISIALPELPVYLIAAGKHSSAAANIAKLLGKPHTHPRVLVVYDEMLKLVQSAQSIEPTLTRTTSVGTWRDRSRVFLPKVLQPKYRHALAVGVGIMVLQQLSGINYFFYYGQQTFALVGVALNPYACTAILSATNCIFLAGGVLTVSHCSRRRPLFWGAVVACLTMFAYTLLCGAPWGSPTRATGGLAVAFAGLFIATFALTYGPIPCVYLSELFPFEVRQQAMLVCFLANCLANFAVTLATPPLVLWMGSRLGYVFAACMAAAAVFVHTCAPETTPHATPHTTAPWRLASAK